MPYPLTLPFHLPLHLIRNDASSSSSGGGGGTNEEPAPPALSPSAIVGLAIIAGIFLTVLLAAVLRLCYRPTPQETNPSSLYRPDDSNVAQLTRLKQVREIYRLMAWERAREAEVEAQAEMEVESTEVRMSSVFGVGGRTRGLHGGVGWGGDLEAGGGGGGGAERGRRRDRDRDRQWTARMGLSAMEAGGEVEVEEHWDLTTGGGERGYGPVRARGYDSGMYEEVDEEQSSAPSGGGGGGGVKGNAPAPQRRGVAGGGSEGSSRTVGA